MFLFYIKKPLCKILLCKIRYTNFPRPLRDPPAIPCNPTPLIPKSGFRIPKSGFRDPPKPQDGRLWQIASQISLSSDVQLSRGLHGMYTRGSESEVQFSTLQ